MELKQLHEDMQKTWRELKGMLDRQEAEVKKYGETSAETKTIIGQLNTKLDDVEKRIGVVEAKAARLPLEPDPATSKPAMEAKAAFLNWARYGAVSPEEQKLLTPWQPGPEERRALAVGTATAAGFLAPTEYVREILKGVIEFSPLRGVCRIRTTSAKAIQVPKRTGVFAATWVAEGATRTETTGLTYGLEEIPTHEMYALVDVSFQQLEDSAFDLEAILNEEFSEQFGVAEGAAFVNGSAVGRPEGVLTNAAVGVTNSGAAAALTADGLISIFYDLKDVYARNATWVLRRASLKAIRQLKDTTNNYLWAPGLGPGGGLTGGAPATILDRPYIEALDMPAIAANAFPVAIGDFRRGYMIVDRLEIAVVRDPFTQAASGNVRFHARKRIGGQVVIAEAIRKQQVAA